MAILAYDDVMLREPRLLVPNSKPLGPVRIDFTHPLARGLMSWWSTMGQYRAPLIPMDLCRYAARPTLYGTPDPVASSWRVDQADNTYLDISGVSTYAYLSQVGTFTIVWRARVDTPDDGTGKILCGNSVTSAEAGVYVTFEDRSGVAEQAIRLAMYPKVSSNSTIYFRENIVPSVWHTGGVSVNANTSATLCIDGILYTMTRSPSTWAANSNTPTRTMNIWRGNYSSHISPFKGDWSDLLIFKRTLSDAELSTLCADLYQTIIPG
jgi:hypothetical protein